MGYENGECRYCGVEGMEMDGWWDGSVVWCGGGNFRGIEGWR